MSWRHGTRGDWMYSDRGSHSHGRRSRQKQNDDSDGSSDDSLANESPRPNSSRAMIKSKELKAPKSRRRTTNGHGEVGRDLKKMSSRTDDSDCLSAEEWKIVSDHDDEEDIKKSPAASLPRKKPDKTLKTKTRKKRGVRPRHKQSPIAGDSPNSASSSGRRNSQTEANAFAAIMTEKHPWRRRRGSNGEDPIPSPPPPRGYHGHSTPSHRPAFKALDDVTSRETASPAKNVASPVSNVGSPGESASHGDASSVASYASSSSTSSGSSQSSTRSSLGGLDSGGDVESEEEEFTVAFEEEQAAVAADATADAFPLSFLDPTAVTNPYLDQTLLDKGITRTDANRFALEHRIFLRAILQLLAERDHVGVEANVDDPENTIKKGPLKKFSRVTGRPATWKVKYVEVRKGSFSYFEDSSKTLEMPGRKIIPLRANMYNCRAVDDYQNIKGASGYILELTVEDGPTRLWMTNSEEERQAWIRAIRDATIGGDMDSNPHYMDMRPYADAIEKYTRIQGQLGGSRIKNEYVSSLAPLWGKSLRVPVPWVRQHLGLDVDKKKFNHKSSELSSTPMATVVKSRVTDLWEKLSRESVSIDGHLMKGDRPHGTERIVGALSRCILEHDHASTADAAMSELQAISHARNVLLAYYKSRSRDEAYFAIDSMCRNANLVVCLPSNNASQSPLHIQVYSAGAHEMVVGEEEKCGWVLTRSGAPKRWKNRYCVVSEGVLSYYEHCSPRPHGLRGQLVLVGATMERVSLDTGNSCFVLKLVTRDGMMERELCFRNEMDMTLWREAIQHTIQSCTSPAMSAPRKNAGSPMKKLKPKIGKGRLIKGATEKIRGMLPEKMPSFDGTNTAAEEAIMSSDSMKSENKDEPTVQILVESSRYYKIVTADPSLSDKTWCTIRTNYLHSFLLSGGPHGQVSKGDEVVEMEFLEGGVGEDAFAIAFPRAGGA